MNILISYFQQIRYFKPYMIPVSTAMWDPKWLETKNGKKPHIDQNGIFVGIKEESLIFDQETFENMNEQCQKDCPYKSKAPNCQFMSKYLEQLRKIDFKNYLIPELNRVANEVKKILNFQEEPEIVLMVHEKPDILCSERPVLKKVFAENGIELKEWTKDRSGLVF